MNPHNGYVVEWKNMKAVHIHTYVQPAKARGDQRKKKQTYGQIFAKTNA